jgi:hypothetical protein
MNENGLTNAHETLSTKDKGENPKNFQKKKIV